MLVFDQENGIVFPSFQLVHRHDADARSLTMAVRELIVDNRLINCGLCPFIAAFLAPKPRQLP